MLASNLLVPQNKLLFFSLSYLTATCYNEKHFERCNGESTKYKFLQPWFLYQQVAQINLSSCEFGRGAAVSAVLEN